MRRRRPPATMASSWPRVVVIGAGVGGLCMGIRLKKAGLENFTIFDKADAVGGVWFHNTYPGAACDVPTHLYSFSFELKSDWTRPYATQPEIRAYLEHCVDTYGLGPHLRLSTEVTDAVWDEEAAHWRVRTAAGEQIDADVVVSGVGMFNEVNWPDIPGLADFPGKVFHSARWDHDHDLGGRSVAVIGTGPSAVQFIPEIAPVAGRLTVFQRSAGWVLPKRDVPFTDEEVHRYRSSRLAVRRHRFEIWRGIEKMLTFEDEEARGLAEAFGRAHLEVVTDPHVRTALTPTDGFGCKRPIISNDYYPTFNRPNVDLVTAPITGVTAAGIVTSDGVEHPCDTIVLGTGFRAGRFASAIDIVGRDGVGIAEAWAGGPHAYLGIATTGFPNLFMLYGPNTNNGSIIFMIERQTEYVVRLLRRMRRRRHAWVDVRRRVMDRYNRRLHAALDANPAWNAPGCRNYYRDPSSGKIVTQWPHRTLRYWLETRRPGLFGYESARR